MSYDYIYFVYNTPSLWSTHHGSTPPAGDGDTNYVDETGTVYTDETTQIYVDEG